MSKIPVGSISMTTSDDTDYSQAGVNLALTPEAKVRLLREMHRIRAFEFTALQHYQAGRMGGFLILQTGQEAIPVAVRSMMGPEDHTICSLRGMGTALAAGMSMREGMAELFGRATGCSKGRGGQFGFYAPQHRHWGGHGYAGTQTALAAGLAFGLKHQGKRGAVFCYLGDGAVNQGTFHESLNLASLFSLPVIYLIENNGYAMGTSVRRSSAIKGSLAERAAGYNIEWDLINGDHVYESRAKLQPAIARAYRDQRPTVLEISTYRFEGFTIADASKFKYRSRQEVTERQESHDPLQLWAAQLMSENLMDQGSLKRIKEVAFAEARAAAYFAWSSPRLPPEAILSDVYWEVDCATAAGTTGRHFFND